MKKKIKLIKCHKKIDKEFINKKIDMKAMNSLR